MVPSINEQHIIFPMVPFLSHFCHAWPRYLSLKMGSKIWIFPSLGNQCKTNNRIPCWRKRQKLKSYVFSSRLVLKSYSERFLRSQWILRCNWQLKWLPLSTLACTGFPKLEKSKFHFPFLVTNISVMRGRNDSKMVPLERWDVLL